MVFSRFRKPTFSISIPRGVLDAIFDECDGYAVDETGGRLIGTYKRTRGRFDINVQGVLDAGPRATRSPTSFFQDGAYQEQAFRAIEAAYPEIEHLGSWHTHHVNGYPTLSGGDKTTYFKTVNHKNHNTDFFYALLVVSKNGHGDPRYAVKHFVFHRNDDNIYEIPNDAVTIVNAPALNPASRAARPYAGTNPERAKDLEFLGELYPSFKPMLARAAGAPYWKGSLSLIDGTKADVVAMEDAEGGSRLYSIATSLKTPAIAQTVSDYRNRQFRSARHAIHEFERDLNQALYRAKKT